MKKRHSRPLWERITLAHIRTFAEDWHRADTAHSREIAEAGIYALAGLLQHVRGAYARRAVVRHRWASEALGMFEEDA